MCEVMPPHYYFQVDQTTGDTEKTGNLSPPGLGCPSLPPGSCHSHCIESCSNPLKLTPASIRPLTAFRTLVALRSAACDYVNAHVRNTISGLTHICCGYTTYALQLQHFESRRLQQCPL